MLIHHFTPFSMQRDLGRAYNNCMAQVGEMSAACLRDQDTMFLTPDAGEIIHNYCEQNPMSVMVCYTNRIHAVAREQLLTGVPSGEADITHHIRLAEKQREQLYTTTVCTGPLSGFLMIVPKAIWNKVKFKEGVGLLGVDTEFFKDLRRASIPVLRMNGLYLFHTYRLTKDITDTSHLKT